MGENSIKSDYKEKNTMYKNILEVQSSKLLFDNSIWRVDDVSRFLNCSVGHIYNLVSDEKIPKKKKGGLLYFIPNEILNWVLEGD